MRGLFTAYWRIPVIALLGGLIAFGGSFIASEKYTSTTRVLIRGREATFLTSSGTDLSQAPGDLLVQAAEGLGKAPGSDQSQADDLLCEKIHGA